MPTFQYHVPGVPQPVFTGSPHWHDPLPMDRHTAESPVLSEKKGVLTQGDYYFAARNFLERNRFDVLLSAVSGKLRRAVSITDIDTVHITIIKHGAFYHPALIEVSGRFEPLSFVLNTACSEAGRKTIQGEYLALEKLSRVGEDSPVPTVYGRATMNTAVGCLDMFLGDWLQGFHEFHLSRDTARSAPRIRVWDDARGFFFLTPDQQISLYRQAAFILTRHYNLRTFEQIFPWHHAAGDFVVRVDAEGVRVRLITVRQYIPLFRDMEMPRDTPDGVERMMTALLIFFINMALRMRIDRLDGTGELVWAEQDVVAAVWAGFQEGLGRLLFPPSFPANLTGEFLKYLSTVSVSDFFELTRAAAGGFHPEAPERGLMASCLVDHVATQWVVFEQEGVVG